MNEYYVKLLRFRLELEKFGGTKKIRKVMFLKKVGKLSQQKYEEN